MMPDVARRWAAVLIAALVSACENGTGPTPVPAPDLVNSLALGSKFACALDRSGAAFCWGSSDHGELGNGSTTFSATPVPVSGSLRFKQIVATDHSVCGLTTDDEVYCWGRLPETLDPAAETSPTPVPVSEGFQFAAIGVGLHFACGLDAEGLAHCWGRNGSGQLGTGDSLFRGSPAAVAGGRRYVSLSVGLIHACSLTSGGEAYCWGDERYGEFGDGTQRLGPTPQQVTGAAPFKAILAGSAYTCGVSNANTGYCWGNNVSAQLGDGTVDQRYLPSGIDADLAIASIAPARVNRIVTHTCAMTLGGETYCWGFNQHGQVGTTNTTTCSVAGGLSPCVMSPILVVGVTAPAKIDAGEDHTCAIFQDRSVSCWGANDVGQLGDGTQTPRSVPGGVRPPFQRNP